MGIGQLEHIIWIRLNIQIYNYKIYIYILYTHNIVDLIMMHWAGDIIGNISKIVIKQQTFGRE